MDSCAAGMHGADVGCSRGRARDLTRRRYTRFMRYLAIDLGDVRTGLAVGADSMKIASPAGVVEGRTDAMRLAGIKKAIDEHWPDALVLGLPLNMDDSEGPRVELVRAFAAQLQRRFDLPVHLVDERLTSAAADEAMSQTGFTRGQKKARRDALAAAAILRNFWGTRDRAAGDDADEAR